jgi:hypothetical protein
LDFRHWSISTVWTTLRFVALSRLVGLSHIPCQNCGTWEGAGSGFSLPPSWIEWFRPSACLWLMSSASAPTARDEHLPSLPVARIVCPSSSREVRRSSL